MKFFGAREKYNMVDRSVDRAKSVFTKTINKLVVANDKLENMVVDLNAEIEERQSVVALALEKKDNNSKMIEKINSLLG